MTALTRRVCRLEDRLGSTDRRFLPVRVVVRTLGGGESLEIATCHRTLAPNGALCEMVNLNGSRDECGNPSDEELDQGSRASRLNDMGAAGTKTNAAAIDRSILRRSTGSARGYNDENNRPTSSQT